MFSYLPSLSHFKAPVLFSPPDVGFKVAIVIIFVTLCQAVTSCEAQIERESPPRLRRRAVCYAIGQFCVLARDWSLHH